MKTLSFFVAIIFSAQLSAGSLHESLQACEHLSDAQARHFALMKNEVLSESSELKPVFDLLYVELRNTDEFKGVSRQSWNKITANSYQQNQSYWELFKDFFKALGVQGLREGDKKNQLAFNKIAAEVMSVAVSCIADVDNFVKTAACNNSEIINRVTPDGRSFFYPLNNSLKNSSVIKLINAIDKIRTEIYGDNNTSVLINNANNKEFEEWVSYASDTAKSHFDEYKAWIQIYQWLAPYTGPLKVKLKNIEAGSGNGSLDDFYSSFTRKARLIAKMPNYNKSPFLEDHEIYTLKSKWLGKLLGDLYQSDLINQNTPVEKEQSVKSLEKPKKSKKKKKSKTAKKGVKVESEINSEGDVAQVPTETNLPTPEKTELQEPVVPEGKLEETKVPSSPKDSKSDDNSNTVETQAVSQDASGEDEEEFDLLAYLNFWKNNSKAVSKNQPASKEGKGEQQKPKIRLDDDARKVIEASFHYGDSIIKRRDFISCVQQLGGKLLKGRGNGTSYYSLPNYEGEKTSRPFMLFRIHLPHTGSEDLRRGDLTAFFKRALETVGITKEMIE